jgi:hypothetical protein
MSARPSDSVLPLALFGLEGELVLLRVTVEPKLLEDLLEALSSLDFPVNPQLYHRPAEVAVEFPAYSAQVQHVRDALHHSGFNPTSLEVSSVLTLARGA